MKNIRGGARALVTRVPGSPPPTPDARTMQATRQARRRQCVWALPLLFVTAESRPLLELHADNFDRVLEQNAFVLVHFWASCAQPDPLAM